MTLESYSFTMAADSGAHALFAECKFVEVREVETNVTTESGIPPGSCKNASSASTTGTGKAGTSQTAEADKPGDSVLYKGFGS